MSLSDIGSIANLLAAIGVLITLIYLARQVRQGNLLAKFQVRQHMVRAGAAGALSMEERSEPAQLVRQEGAAVRNRAGGHALLPARGHAPTRVGVVPVQGRRDQEGRLRGLSRSDRAAPRHRSGPAAGGKRSAASDSTPRFVADVDAFLAKPPTTTYFEQIRDFDMPVAGGEAKVA